MRIMRIMRIKGRYFMFDVSCIGVITADVFAKPIEALPEKGLLSKRSGRAAPTMPRITKNMRAYSTATWKKS